MCARHLKMLLYYLLKTLLPHKSFFAVSDISASALYVGGECSEGSNSTLIAAIEPLVYKASRAASFNL